MNLDLYVDTSRKGISMALSAQADKPETARYEETVNTEARGEILGATLDDLLGKRALYGVTTLQALECFGQNAAGKECAEAAVIIRARTGFWYMRLNGEEFFIETPEVIERLKNAKVKAIVADAPAQEDEALKACFNSLVDSCLCGDDNLGSENDCKRMQIVCDTGKPLDMWAPLFDTVKPSLIQEANYIQPSYFEKLKT